MNSHGASSYYSEGIEVLIRTWIFANLTDQNIVDFSSKNGL